MLSHTLEREHTADQISMESKVRRSTVRTCEPFIDHSSFLCTRKMGEIGKIESEGMANNNIYDSLFLEFGRNFDVVSNRSANLWNDAVRRDIISIDSKARTVSSIPDALGFPSTRIGFPPMYFESFLSNGSSVWL